MAAPPHVGVSTADRNYLPSLVFCVVRSVAARPLRARRSLCFPPARPVFRVCSLALPLSARRLRAARVVFLLHNPMVINHTTSASTSQPNTRLVEVGAPIDPELTADAEEGGDVGPLGAGAGTSLHRQSPPRAPAPGGRQAQRKRAPAAQELPLASAAE